MDARIKELLTRLSFFAQDGMTDKPIVEIAKQADALLTELGKQQNTQQPVAYRWRFGSESLDTRWHYSDVPLVPYSDRTVESLYTAPPVPRDVLMAAMTEVCGWIDANDPWPDLNEIADRYASQVQPVQTYAADAAMEGMKRLGYQWRDGAWYKNATQPEPVNQQAIDDDAKLRIGQYLTEELPTVAPDVDWGDARYMDQLVDGICTTIAAAEAAQPVGRDAVALLREIEWENNKWAECCPVCGEHKKDGHAVDCKLAATLSCQQPVSAQPVAVPDVIEHLQLAETEVTNAKAWSAGEQAKTHCKYALTAIAVARSLLSAAQKPEGV